MPPLIDRFYRVADAAEAAAAEVLGHEMPIKAWVGRAYIADEGEAIRIVVLVPKARMPDVTGKQLIDIVSKVEDALPAIGETRTPIISFAHIEDWAELEGA